MKVYNVTDVSTPRLEARGQVNLAVTLGGVLIPPGECREVPPKYRAEALRYMGALVVDHLPAEYLKGEKVAPRKKVREPQRVFTKKTKVEEPPPPKE